jgi:hypothetical protein
MADGHQRNPGGRPLLYFPQVAPLQWRVTGAVAIDRLRLSLLQDGSPSL